MEFVDAMIAGSEVDFLLSALLSWVFLDVDGLYI